uniref:TBC1 domain family member 13 n=1 Tax=Rhabditophanes sp. KR3021 TaxID=114890 RepID=A0AC35UFU0_9BILA
LHHRGGKSNLSINKDGSDNGAGEHSNLFNNPISSISDFDTHDLRTFDPTEPLLKFFGGSSSDRGFLGNENGAAHGSLIAGDNNYPYPEHLTDKSLSALEEFEERNSGFFKSDLSEQMGNLENLIREAKSRGKTNYEYYCQ